jgi:hypothetical protein
MEILNLKKLWEVCNILSDKQGEFHEKDIYIYFMGRGSEYSSMSFEGFLDYYSFKIIKDEVLVFNNDPVSWESYTTNDFSYIPLNLLLGGEKDLEEYIKTETEKQLERIEKDKLDTKIRIEKDIERLNNILKTL